MNQKRDEIVQFLDKDLLPQVKDEFDQYKSADQGTVTPWSCLKFKKVTYED